MNPEEFGVRVAAAKREIRGRSLDGIERRMVTSTIEVRDGDAGRQIVGYGYVFNSLSENLGGFREVIAPGAGADVLAGTPDIRGLFNHNPDLVLGRTTAGTMSVEEDDTGSRYLIDAPDTSYARDLLVSLERGDVNQSSFAFRIARGGDVWDEDPESGLLLRTITKFSGLYDMSPVTYPAYPETSSGVRTAPDVERVDDEPAGQRVHDGDIEERQADKGLSLSFVRRDLAARERLLNA